MSIGKRIKNTRLEKGLTQKQLGDKLGVTQQMIGLYEKNQGNPKIDTLERIAQALDVSVTYIIWGNTDNLSTYEKLSDTEKKMLSILISTENKRDETISNYWNHKIEKKKESIIISLYNKLNEEGKEKALAYITDLTQIEKYQNKTDN